MARKSANSSTPRPTTPDPSSVDKPAAATPAAAPPAASTPSPAPAATVNLSAKASPLDVANAVWTRYQSDTPQRTKLIDVFMVFLVAVGVVQFAYCVLAGNYVRSPLLPSATPIRIYTAFNCILGNGYYVTVFPVNAMDWTLLMFVCVLQPFNAFLAGFAATVGQFVLTASLRIQTNPANKSEFSSVSPERAFADFVFGSLILHFFCVNFIN
ncbi:hypothetical protein Dda_1265 [Drechslerella dactyloides]|uniref:Dolichyl-diphosphooligosaccharide--protein glycosyltransferase subunit OST2 n=1 Tax=Drechslerella dactyloides TaxID=74499 RepID=A0AAD6J1E6_DREDA|nr:hypothetical protein Dda_1265 [Drechslerella dactyloides]